MLTFRLIAFGKELKLGELLLFFLICFVSESK